MANLGKLCFRIIAVGILFSVLSGCGAEEDSSKVLSWNPPTTYSDSTPLDPARDLEGYEIYVNESGTFSDADTHIAEAGAIVPGTGQLLTSFDLANLAPFLSPGITYHVSIRAVAFSGLKSGFSSAASFSF